MAISVPIASSVCRERIVPEIPRLPIGCTPMRTGTKQTLLAASITGSSRDRIVFEAFGVEQRYHRAGAIDLLFIRKQRAPPRPLRRYPQSARGCD